MLELQVRPFCRLNSVIAVFVRGGYTGKLIDGAKQTLGYKVEVVKRNEQRRFRVQPKRWIVEYAFAWLYWSHLLSKDLITDGIPDAACCFTAANGARCFIAASS